ncbi:MAG: hypothetical protein ABW068_16375, partial [Candidatus Thiodiazotropha sp.]
PTARRVSSIASRLPGTTSLRFAFPGWQRSKGEGSRASLTEGAGEDGSSFYKHEPSSRHTPSPLAGEGRGEGTSNNTGNLRHSDQAANERINRFHRIQVTMPCNNKPV